MYNKFLYSDATSIDTHWEYCVNNRIPHIVITSEKGGRYCKVDYDILPCSLISISTEVDLPDETQKLYNAYCNFTLLPKGKIFLIGGGNSATVRLFKEHGEIIAEKLFDYLGAQVRPWVTGNEKKYGLAMDELYSNHSSLREVFDVASSEYQNTTLEQKIVILAKLLKSTHNFSQ